VHRVLGFTRHLPAHGWACTVVCAGEEDYWVRDESLTARIPTGTEVIRVPGGSVLSAWLRLFRRGDRIPGDRVGALRRLSDFWLLPDSYVGWIGRARAAAARRLARGDVQVLLSSSPPESVHLAALPLAGRFRVPWVADFRDPWIGLYRRRSPTAWHASRQAALERRVMERADLVLATSQTQMGFTERGSRARPGRVAIVRNGFEPESSELAAGRDDAAGDPALRPFLLAFTGTVALLPETEVFLDALHDLLARHPGARRRLRVKLAGPFDSTYQDRAVALGLTGIVEFLGQRPHREVRELQRRADVLLLWLPHGEVLRAAVPGKLYEYLDAGRPLVAVLDERDEATALVRRAGGRVVAPGSRAALTVELERRWREWKERGRLPAVRPEWLGEYSREHQAGVLADLLDDLAGRRS
jgi:hypothetical protein